MDLYVLCISRYPHTYICMYVRYICIGWTIYYSDMRYEMLSLYILADTAAAAAAAVGTGGGSFMIAINILINDLLNYNTDRYLPTQLRGGALARWR